MGEYKIFSLFFSSQSKALLLMKSLGCSRRWEVSMWRESLQHRFKHLKTGIAGKRSETHNYSSIPRCGHNNFIVSPLVSLTSFTGEVWSARGHSLAAGGLSVIGTVCLMTFFYIEFFITRRPFSFPFNVHALLTLRKMHLWPASQRGAGLQNSQSHPLASSCP